LNLKATGAILTARARKKGLKIEAVDLFCGAGGLSYGLSLEGISVRAGYDLDPACEWPFEKNVRADFHCRDVEQLTGAEIKSHFSQKAIKLLAGMRTMSEVFKLHAKNISS
jgi:predicted RNA methylase